MTRWARRSLYPAGVALFLASMVLAAGCSLTHKVPEDAIAVVGKRALTPADVTKNLDEMGLDSKNEQYRAQVVNKWVDHQLLLHEAQRLGVDKDKEIARRVQELREELIVNKLLENAVEVDTPNAAQVVEYWQNHTGEVTRPTNEVKLIIAYAPTRSMGWIIRNGFDKSRTGDDLKSNYSSIRFDTTSFISVDRLPKPVAKAIEPLRLGQSSLPFEMDGQWSVAKLVEKAAGGRPRPLDEMMPVIRAQMMAEEKARHRYQYIASLRREARRKGVVQINVPADIAINPDHVDNAPAADSSTTKTTPEEE